MKPAFCWSTPGYSSMDVFKTALEQGAQECYIEPDWSFVYEICVDLVIL